MTKIKNKILFLLMALLTVTSLTVIDVQAQRRGKITKKPKAKKVLGPDRQTICDGSPLPKGYYIAEQTFVAACFDKNRTGRALMIVRTDAAPIQKEDVPIQKNDVLSGDSNPKPPCIENDGPNAGKPCKRDAFNPAGNGATIIKVVPRTVSGGVVNGKATNLVKPIYPAAAKAVRAGGAVNVQVLIDELGNVISASATSGSPLLRAAAVEAARASKFAPTRLQGQLVKVNGVVVFNFLAQ